MKKNFFESGKLDQKSKVSPRESTPKISPSLEKLVRKYWRPSEMKINGKMLNFIGLAHDPKTLEIPEFRKYIEKRIGESSVVLLEYSPSNTEEETIGKMAQVASELSEYSRWKKIEIEHNMYKQLYENSNMEFWRQIEGVAARKKTRVAVSDPLKNIHSSFLLDRQDEKVKRTKALSLIASLAAASGMFGGKTILKMLEKIGKASDLKKLSEKNMSRRDFFKWAGFGFATVAGFDYLSMEADCFERSDSKHNRAKNPLGFFLYDLLDYRNAAVAEKLDNLTKGLVGEKPVTVIYGAAHTEAIKHYLKNPIERKAKLLAYAPYRATSYPETGVFEHNGKKWKNVEQDGQSQEMAAGK